VDITARMEIGNIHGNFCGKLGSLAIARFDLRS